MNKQKLVREQLEVSLRRFGLLKDVNAPRKGWVRGIRDALGMSAKQLARRLGTTQQAVARIERDEPEGAVTIKTMRRVAKSLDCMFVYGFVPRSTLEHTLREQAKRVALKRLHRASQTMALEDQALDPGADSAVLAQLVDELVEDLPSNLWDETQ